jgi:hypothetical protein
MRIVPRSMMPITSPPRFLNGHAVAGHELLWRRERMGLLLRWCSTCMLAREVP